MKQSISELKGHIFFYLENLGSYDYILLACLLAGFLVLMIFAFWALFRSQFLGAIFISLAVVYLLCGGYFGYNYIEDNFRTRELQIVNLKQLAYSDTFLLELNLTNKSSKAFHICRVNVEFIKNSKNQINKIKNTIKPLKSVFAQSEGRISPNQSVELNMTIYNFRPQDYNITTFSQCF